MKKEHSHPEPLHGLGTPTEAPLGVRHLEPRQTNVPEWKSSKNTRTDILHPGKGGGWGNHASMESSKSKYLGTRPKRISQPRIRKVSE